MKSKGLAFIIVSLKQRLVLPLENIDKESFIHYGTKKTTNHDLSTFLIFNWG